MTTENAGTTQNTGTTENTGTETTGTTETGTTGTGVADFDPFRFALLYRSLKNVHPAWLTLVGLVIIGLLFVVSSIEGTVGSGADLQAWEDIRRAVGVPSAAPAKPDFPLMRDITTWFLVLVLINGAILLHRQWRHMSTCLSQLAANGVLLPRADIKSNFFSRALLIDRMIRGTRNTDALDTIVRKVTDKLTRHSTGLFVSMIAAALVLSILLTLGLENSLFQVLAPDTLDSTGKQRWLEEAYDSWWASKTHAAGYILYCVLAWFAIFVILSFQVVGVIAIYLVLAMHFVVKPSADWLNRDGRYGWSPLAKLYRTVVWSHGLLGATLAVVLAVLGIDNYGWVFVLVVAYIVLVPIFTVVPWLAFRRVAGAAQSARVEEIQEIIAARGIDPTRDIELLAPLMMEIERCRAARIRPLRMGSASLSTYLLLVGLPVVLTAAQIIVPLNLGTP